MCIHIWIAIHIERGRGDRVAFVTAASRKELPYWRVSRYWSIYYFSLSLSLSFALSLHLSLSLCMCIYICSHAHIYTYKQRGDCMTCSAAASGEDFSAGGGPGTQSYYISVYLSIYVYHYVCLSMYICMYACMHVCIYLYPCIYHSIVLRVNSGSR